MPFYSWRFWRIHMRLKHYNGEVKYLDRTPTTGFVFDLKLIDKNLDVGFNRITGRWEIWRLGRKGWEWILQVENEDETYRPLDNRTLRKLREMDIISRWGSIDNYERHLDEKQKKWKEDRQKEYDHELRCDLKDDKILWRRAAENFRSGIVNDPPEQKKDKKAISFPK